MSEEWGPWIEHDGKGCPCLGAWALTERVAPIDGAPFESTGTYRAFIEGRIREPANWDWSRFGERLPDGKRASKILRYRIRKPRGLTMLEEIAKGVREPVDA